MREAATVVLLTAELDEVELRRGDFVTGRFGGDELMSAWSLAEFVLRRGRKYCADEVARVRYVDVVKEKLDPATHTVLDAHTESFEVWGGHVVGPLALDATLGL